MFGWRLNFWNGRRVSLKKNMDHTVSRWMGVMTLYGYIENKEDLLDAIALRGLADLQLVPPLPETAIRSPPRTPLWSRAFVTLD